MPLFDLPLAELETYVPALDEPADLDAFWARTLAESREAGGDLARSVRLERVEAREWITRAAPEEQTSAQLAPRVAAARERQQQRQGCLNARLRAANTLAECRLEKVALRALEAACERYQLSARSGHRLARVARSIADLEGEETVSDRAVAEAAQLRLILDRD